MWGTQISLRALSNSSTLRLGAPSTGELSPRLARVWTDLVGSHEFATNEVINVVQSVNLETLSTEAGNKDFVAVATSIHRGEDLAVRGAVRFFFFFVFLGFWGCDGNAKWDGKL